MNEVSNQLFKRAASSKFFRATSSISGTRSMAITLPSARVK